MKIPKWKSRYLRVLSRHPSHSVLRNAIRVPKGKLCVLRLGSVTPTNMYDLEINTVQSIENTANKRRMKELFVEAGVSSPKFYPDVFEAEVDVFPVLAKLTYRSRGAGMKKLNSQEELDNFRNSIRTRRKNATNPYYLEQYHNYTKEYRLHVSTLGECFYTCRKVLKQEFAGSENNWYRNDSNCNWLLEENESFDKPTTWDQIVADCVQALNALGLTIGCFDIRVAKNGRWMIIEANSAPSFGEKTSEAYFEELNKIIDNAF